MKKISIKKFSIEFKHLGCFLLLFCLLILSGCGVRNVYITPSFTRPMDFEGTLIPYSVYVDFEPVVPKFGPKPTSIALNTENIKQSLNKYLILREVFPERNVKLIKGNYSDYILKCRISNIALRNTMKGFIYNVTIEARLIDHAGESVNVYRGKSDIKGANVRFDASTDAYYVNQIVNSAFYQICTQIEDDYKTGKIIDQNITLTKEEWGKVESVLLNSLNAPAPEFRKKAIRDLSSYMKDGSISSSIQTIEPLITALTDTVFDVRNCAVKSIGQLGKSNNSVVEALISQIQSSDDTRKKGYIALTLAYISDNAQKAIPHLIESFPQFNESRKFKEEIFYPQTGIIEYRVLKDEKLDSSHPKAVPNIQLLKNQFGKYVEIVNVSGVYRHYLVKDNVTNEYIHDDIFLDMLINYDIHAGAYALHKITGKDLGIEKEKWQKWWNENK